ncbi:uncharacterized protein PG998_004072 [Apiospora kogelbergensis]|uniref:uncharacterized protein n=1 Tax=Apiospora kogelbergensis TaxID=1337665 RepID=UPI00312FBD9F
MSSWLSRLTPTERGEDPLKKLGETSQEKLGDVSQRKPQLEQGILPDKLAAARKQAQIMSANDKDEYNEKETQREHLARHVDQLYKSESPKPPAIRGAGEGNNDKAAAYPPEIEYDDLFHEPGAESQKPERHTTGKSPKDLAHGTNRPGQQQTIVPIITKDTTLKPTQDPTQALAGVYAPRPTPTSDRESSNKSPGKSPKEPAQEYSEKPGKEPDSDEIKQLHHVCRPFHEHISPDSPNTDGQSHLRKVVPEPLASGPEDAHEKGKNDLQHTEHDTVVAKVHQADCDEHPDTKVEHLVADSPRLGKMMAVYQKIEAKQKQVKDKMTRSKEDKEKKAKDKQEAKEKEGP